MKQFHLFFVLVNFLAVAANVNAEQVVYSNQCQQIKNKKAPFMLVLKKGQHVPASILQCVTQARIENASISGLGAFQDPTLAYYNLPQKKYINKNFPGVYELLGLTGDVSSLDNKPYLHMHAILGSDQYTTIGGHVAEAVVGATAEIMITPIAGKSVREFDDETGLNLITPQA